MAQQFTMPKFGQTMEEGTVVSWKKQIGDSIVKGDVLLEVETDKALMDVDCEIEGVLLAILVEEGATCECGTPIAWIGEKGERIPE